MINTMLEPSTSDAKLAILYKVWKYYLFLIFEYNMCSLLFLFFHLFKAYHVGIC